ncbi:MAG TPA: hypothetical protein VNC59_04010, partial [Thermoanaerobaculia bacterium]|nr:hypothetical protein [Thermoanaerobaculia bacterium]
MRNRLLLPALFLAAAATVAPAHAARVHGFEVSVVMDGSEAPEYHQDGKIYVEALKGREFTVRLSNPTAERIAVALSVDGRNVVDAKRTTAQGAAKWVLAPGQTVEIPGWQVSGDTSRKFFFTETGRSYAKWLGDTRNVGTIEAVFFREKRRWVSPPAVERDSGSGAREEEGVRRQDAPAASAAPESAPEKRESDRFAATGIGDRTD